MPELKPKLIVNTGGMYASKSTTLLAQGQRHSIAGHKVVYIKPATDNRYSTTEIATHNGNKVEAVVKAVDSELWDQDVIHSDVVLIDEAQFFTDLAFKVERMLSSPAVSSGKVVYVSGLDMDYTGKPFKEMADLMAMADEVIKLKAVCSHCGDDSTFSSKVSGSMQDVVEVGGSDMYEPLCRTCYTK